MFKSLKSVALFRRFKADQNGNVALIFGLAIVPFFLAAGAAIDFGRYSGAKTHVQSALDAAALAGAAGTKISDADRIKAAKASFEHNIKSGVASQFDVKPKFEIEDNRVIGSAELDMPTSFMALAGLSNLKNLSTAEVGIQVEKKTEVVLVLDYSGSMGDPVDGKIKYKTMRTAAKNLVTDLEKIGGDKVKIGLVPFSHMIHTTLPAAHVKDGGSGLWTGCTQDRPYPKNLSTSTPTTEPETLWNQALYDAEPDQLKYTCEYTKLRSHNLISLTDDFKAVSHQLDIMKPYGYTHIALGVEFGYHVLSPNAPFTNGADFSDKETKKFLVVLTDGKQTAGAFGKSNSRTPENGNSNLVDLCINAKSDKITIMTMAFDLDDADTLTRLRNCSTNPDKDYFVASDSEALTAAFESVKAAITSEVYLSK